MEIPFFFGVENDGKSKAVSAQVRQNVYYEFRRDKDRTLAAIHGTPGLELFADFGATPIRGWVKTKTLIYLVHRGTFYSVNNAGVKTTLGTLDTTSGRVDLDFNGTEIGIVDGTAGYLYNIALNSFFKIEQISTGTTTATTANKLVDSGASFDSDGTKVGMVAHNTTDGTRAIITAIDSATVLSVDADVFENMEDYEIGEADFPNGATTIRHLDRYLLVEIGSRFRISGQQVGGSWDATEFSSAEQQPDGIVRLFVDHQEVILFGEETTEYFANTQAADFPFSPVQGTSDEWGLAAKWSVAKYDNSYMYLAKNTMGEVMLARSRGYQPVPIDNDDFHSIINARNFTVSDATAFAYLLGGHPMYQINFPSEDLSFLYDGKSNTMSTLKSDGIGRHRAELHLSFLGKHYVSDFENGKIYLLDPSLYTDNGAPIQRMLRSRHDYNPQHTERIVSRLQVLMETGVGLDSGQGSDPKMMLRVSKDLGRTWSVEHQESVGKVGETEQPRVLFEDLGSGRAFTYELSYSEPTKFVVTGVNRMKQDAIT